jgi:hypothetical protein
MKGLCTMATHIFRHPAADQPDPAEISKTRATLRLLPTPVDADTVQALEQLLDGARKGEVIGIAFAAMLRGRGVRA